MRQFRVEAECKFRNSRIFIKKVLDVIEGVLVFRLVADAVPLALLPDGRLFAGQPERSHVMVDRGLVEARKSPGKQGNEWRILGKERHITTVNKLFPDKRIDVDVVGSRFVSSDLGKFDFLTT